MVYKVTTLKDLPGIPAGSQFRYDKSWAKNQSFLILMRIPPMS